MLAQSQHLPTDRANKYSVNEGDAIESRGPSTSKEEIFLVTRVLKNGFVFVVDKRRKKNAFRVIA
jgi:hypothetical protein